MYGLMLSSDHMSAFSLLFKVGFVGTSNCEGLEGDKSDDGGLSEEEK